MDFIKMLHVPKDVTLKEFVERFMSNLTIVLNSPIADIDDPAGLSKLREKNEKLSGYLGTVSVLIALYKETVDSKEKEFADGNPAPEKGITAWKENRDLYTLRPRRILQLLEDLRENVLTRLSVAQTNIRSRTKEVEHGI